MRQTRQYFIDATHRRWGCPKITETKLAHTPSDAAGTRQMNQPTCVKRRRRNTPNETDNVRQTKQEKLAKWPKSLLFFGHYFCTKYLSTH